MAKYKKEIKGLGRRIRTARENQRSKVSRETLAQRAKVSYVTLQKIEDGESVNPTAANIMDIAKSLDVKVDKLLGKKVIHTNEYE